MSLNGRMDKQVVVFHIMEYYPGNIFLKYKVLINGARKWMSRTSCWEKVARHKRAHLAWFYIYEGQEEVKLTCDGEASSDVILGEGCDAWWGARGTVLGVLGMCYIFWSGWLICVCDTWKFLKMFTWDLCILLSIIPIKKEYNHSNGGRINHVLRDALEL